MSFWEPPDPGEIEVTLIGPGYGESVVVHLGSNRWMLVDSCRDSKSGSTAPLAYLEGLGVQPSEAVDLVVASHWHDDHVRGLSDVFDQCANAKFCLSAALRKDEFIGLVTRFEQNNLLAGGSGVRELHRILSSATKGRGICLASANRRLLSVGSGDLAHGLPCEVWSLSPADGEILKFLDNIGQMVPDLGEAKYRAMESNKNDLSVVLWVSFAGESFLLGADLEAKEDRKMGWLAIASSRERPMGLASIFKIPHHGSHTGHADEVWSGMVAEEAMCAISPFNRGRTKLPTIADIDRIRHYTEELYISSMPKARSQRRRNQAVERTIRETLIGKLREAEPATGYVRFRKPLTTEGAGWRVDLFGDACHANQYREGLLG